RGSSTVWEHEMAAKNLGKEKQFVFDYVDRHARAVATLGDSIFYFAELGMQERETAALMTGLLERQGFALERGAPGFPTGFCAAWGSGSPVIALHTEYDANPDNSQASGVAERAETTERGPGHCEGHNCNAAVMIAGALAAKHAMEELGIGGTLKVIG